MKKASMMTLLEDQRHSSKKKFKKMRPFSNKNRNQNKSSKISSLTRVDSPTTISQKKVIGIKFLKLMKMRSRMMNQWHCKTQKINNPKLNSKKRKLWIKNQKIKSQSFNKVFIRKICGNQNYKSQNKKRKGQRGKEQIL